MKMVSFPVSMSFCTFLLSHDSIGVFICCDQPFQYISEYFDKLGPSYFRPIRNEELIGVDMYEYVAFCLLLRLLNNHSSYYYEWELSPERALALVEASTRTYEPLAVLDLRDAEDFNKSHIPGSTNLELGARDAPNPYKDPATMRAQFTLLDSTLATNDKTVWPKLQESVVMVISYKGHTARLALSILRSRGIKAHCVIGGYDACIENGIWDKFLQLSLQ
jgi:rhodanese-related sulfurtransferase